MKILIIQQKMIGDVLVSSILCDNLRAAYPKAQIDYMVYESTTSVLDGNPNFDNLILFEKKHQQSKYEYLKLILSIRKEKYNLIIDAYSKIESWLIVFFSNANRKISYWKKGRAFLYTDTVVRTKTSKKNLGIIIEQRLSLLEPLKLDFTLNSFPKIYVSDKEAEFASQFFDKHQIYTSKKTIMVSVIGSCIEKTYPAEYMSKLIDYIAKDQDVNLLFNFMPHQLQEANRIYNLCEDETKNKIFQNAIGKNIREFIAIMNKCDLIIGNDGGAINMAKAINKPSFILFSPWIDKKGWATFEDGINNVSLHLQELKPLLFINKSTKKIKKEYSNLYHEFLPELIYPTLQKFLKNHL